MARDINVKITGDSRDLERALSSASKKTTGFSKTIVSAAKKGSLALAAGFGAGAAFSIKAASDLEESANAINVVFGKASKRIEEFGETSARSVGLSERAFNQAVTPIGAALQNMGFGADAAAEKSVNLTKRAADMASVFNTDVGTALEAIQAGLRGEADPLEKFGVGLSDAAIQAQAAKMGMDKFDGQLTAGQKTRARLALFFQQTDKFAGDFANTSGSLANQQRILRARLEDVAAKIGAKLLPVVVRFLNWLDEEGIPKMQRFIKTMQRWQRAMEDLADSVSLQFLSLASNILKSFLLIVEGASHIPGKLGKPFRAAKQDITDAKRAIDAAHAALMQRKWDRKIKVAAEVSVKFTVPKGVSRVEEIRLQGVGEGKVGAVGDGVVSAGRRFIRSLIPRRGVAIMSRPMARNPGGLKPMVLDELAIANSMGLSLTSGYRPGAVTSTGNPSLHGVGQAIDVAGSYGAMISFAQAVAGRSGVAEVLAPGGRGWYPGTGWVGISGQLAADHQDHVHVGVRSGEGSVGVRSPVGHGGPVAPIMITNVLELDGQVVYQNQKRYAGRDMMRNG